jgi:hypothetical protein
MPYTLWHSGVLIGETDFEGEERHGQHLAGIFRPTIYGRELFPRLTGMLTAGADMKDEMASRGLSEDTMNGDDVVDLFETTAAGKKVVDIGRALSEVELRDPSGHALEVASLAFIDLDELAALSERLGCEAAEDLRLLPPEAPRFIVSATLRAQPVSTHRRELGVH